MRVGSSMCNIIVLKFLSMREARSGFNVVFVSLPSPPVEILRCHVSAA